MKSKVIVLEIKEYEQNIIKQKLEYALNLLGGIESIFKNKKKILLKPNFLKPAKPESAVITHPVVVSAFADILHKKGYEIFLGDSPAATKSEKVIKKSGYSELMKKYNIKLADFENYNKISFKEGILAKQLNIARAIDQVDTIVGISKMKTHAFTRITGAVKNMFGMITGLFKAEYHVKMPDIYDFSKVLIDINMFLKPSLHIMDGILAMEGNGPGSGDPVKMNVVLISKDPVALDSVFCKLINLKPEFVPTNTLGQEYGLGVFEYDKIEILGDFSQELIKKNFNVVRRKPERLISAKSFPPWLKNLISPKPVIDYELCINCGECVEQCPVEPKALNWHDNNRKNKPTYKYDRCIRCYCCQEICPQKAISVKIPLLGKLIYRS